MERKSDSEGCVVPSSMQPDILYGPVFSRRLGRSFGINLFRSEGKVCSFDCVYCECGRTNTRTLTPARDDVYPVDEVLKAVDRAFSKPRTIYTMTFSGYGEPTLHPDFYTIVQGIRSMITTSRPDVELALFTNGSRSGDTSIQSAYQLIDQVMIKLDVGDEETFKKINRPISGFAFSDLIDGLRQTPRYIIQSCLINGGICNVSGEAYSAWLERLGALKPEAVHLYSIERSPWDQSIIIVNPEILRQIERDIRERFSFEVRAFWR